MAHRQAGEADRDIGARAADLERGHALGDQRADRDLVGQRGDVVDQGAQLLRGLAIVECRIQFDRQLQLLEVGGELCLECGVEHGGTPGEGRLGAGGLVPAVSKRWRRQAQARMAKGRDMRRGRPGPGGDAAGAAVSAECLGPDRRARMARARRVLHAERRLRSCRPDPATEPGSWRLPSTWPGRPGRGWRRCTARPSACAGSRRRRARFRCCALRRS